MRNSWLGVMLAGWTVLAGAATWTSLGEATTKDAQGYPLATAISVDSETITRTKRGYIKAWIKEESAAERDIASPVAGAKAYRSAKTLYVFACSQRKIGTLGLLTYDAAGNVLESWTVDESRAELIDVVPESVGEHWMRVVCGLATGRRSNPKAADVDKPATRRL